MKIKMVNYSKHQLLQNAAGSAEGITILNSGGIIDTDYIEGICNVVMNLTSENFVIRDW
jgi:dUTPase